MKDGVVMARALRDTRDADIVLRVYPVKAARRRELVSPLARRANVERLLLAVDVLGAVEGVAGHFGVHAGDVRARLGEVEAGLDRRSGVSAERDGANNVSIGDLVGSSPDNQVACVWETGDVEPLAPAVCAAQLELVDEVARIIDIRQHPAPSCAVLALRLGTEAVIAWGVAAELVVAALSSAACWRTLCVEGVAIVAAVVLRVWTTVRGWVVFALGVIASRLA